MCCLGFPQQEKAMLHCDLRVRRKVASDLRFRAAISEPETPSFCGICGDLAPSTRKSLAIAIVRFWCAKPFRQNSRAAKRGCFKRGGIPIWTRPSFFVLFCPFWDFPDFSGIFPICSGMVRGFSRFVPFLFLGLLRAPTRNSPERVCDTIWTFPEKSGKHPGLETPRFSFSQKTRYTPVKRDRKKSKAWSASRTRSE